MTYHSRITSFSADSELGEGNRGHFAGLESVSPKEEPKLADPTRGTDDVLTDLTLDDLDGTEDDAEVIEALTEGDVREAKAVEAEEPAPALESISAPTPIPSKPKLAPAPAPSPCAKPEHPNAHLTDNYLADFFARADDPRLLGRSTACRGDKPNLAADIEAMFADLEDGEAATASRTETEALSEGEMAAVDALDAAPVPKPTTIACALDASQRPGCFGIGLLYHEGSTECSDCPFEPACASAASDQLARLRSGLRIKPATPKQAGSPTTPATAALAADREKKAKRREQEEQQRQAAERERKRKQDAARSRE